jgi:CubicO group peptidase (beta-lactamase class C family)
LACCVVPAKAEETDKYLSAFILKYKIPALSVGVFRNGQVLKVAGYGYANLELHTPATGESVYEIGSITKQFTAEAVMMLVEESKIGLDDRLSKYLPQTPPAWSQITIRHILTHTAGLKDWDGTGALSYRREYTPAEYIDVVAASPLEFAPGSQSVYTSAGYPLLGLVIQQAAGVPYEEFVTERIFHALGMGQTRFKHPPDIVEHRASGYVDVEGTLRNGEPLRPTIIAPSGGILTTVVDLARWDAALWSGRLLKPATLDLMRQPARLNDGKPGVSGIAWFSDVFHGHTMVLHNGSTVAGFSSVIYRYLSDRLTVAVLCNIDRWNAVNVAAQHVAGLFVPGVSISSLAERPDPDPARGQALGQMLQDVAAGKQAALLVPGLQSRIPAERRAAIAVHLRDQQRFAFLECEDLGAAGAVRFGNLIRSICRYRIKTGAGSVNYTFEFTPGGQVARFVPEED